jgi:hypothetical protein
METPDDRNRKWLVVKTQYDNEPSSLLALPVDLTEGSELPAGGGFLIQFSQWQAPISCSVVGLNNKQQCEILVGYEWPVQLFQPLLFQEKATIPKDALERLHLQRFETDYYALTKTNFLRSFKASTPGKDPPDFRVTKPDGTVVGIDMVQCTLESRRRHHARFQNLKKYLRTHHGSKLRHLTGHVLYFWWPELQNPKQPAKNDELGFKAILNELKTYTPKPVVYEGDDFPQPFPEMNIGKVANGPSFYAHPIRNTAPPTLLFYEAGFEIGLAQSTQITAAEIWAEIECNISKHDKPGNNELILTVAAPDAAGYVYPADPHVWEIALANNTFSLRPKHIRQIYIHNWYNAAIVTLL